VSDGLWLLLYPAAYAGIVLLARKDSRGPTAGVWMDGVVAGLGVTALGAALVVTPVLKAASGSAIAVTTNLAYPVLDLLLVALIVGVASLRGWRLDRAWRLLGLGFLTLALGDTIYLLHVTGGSTTSSVPANIFYMGGVGLIALAAWHPRSEAAAPRANGWSILVVPGVSAIAAIAILLYDHKHDVNDVTVTLASLTIVAAILRMAITFRDVRNLAEARRQAITDDLTSLPNRRLFMQRAEDAIERSRDTDCEMALLILDLDHFKELNDSLGHHAGDHLLRDIGPRLQNQLRESDTLARLGGDEFGLVLSPCSEALALKIAGRLHDALKQPFEVEGLRLHVAASIGIAPFPSHAENAEQLMQHADIAMYEAKTAQSGHEIYENSRNTHTRENLALVSALPEAIRDGQLELDFQPKADTLSRRIVGAEALVRWRHPDRGRIPPDVFVPLMDRANLSRELTRWVLDNSLAACRRWREAGNDIHVAVNMTAADLIDASLPLEIAAALGLHGLPAEALVVEVTETSILSDPGRVQEVLEALRDLGVALDDFGTGYSSLTHLKTLPVNEVKIDRSFVAGMAMDAADAAIVGSTIQLAQMLGLRVVAEGIEDDPTWERLALLNCDLIQGYRLSRPVPHEQLLELLATQARQAVLI
jgi:diguanylate cyclase (GGDEF)-like protein